MAGTAPMLSLVAYLLAFFLLSLGTSQAGSPTIADLRLDLKNLSDALAWQGSIYDTYAPVLQRASEAYGTLTSMTKVIDSDSRAGDVRARLERLIEESRFFTDESSDPEYKPGASETNSYITANVDEWRYAINYMSNNLEKPFCNLSMIAPPKSRRKKILSTMKRGTEFRDAPWTPMMVVIPAGSYVAGASSTEHDRWDVDLDRREFELPKRQVTISRRLAFSKTEITVAQFSAFADQTCYQTRDGSRWWNPANVNQFVFNETLSWRHPGFPQGPDHPVVAITRYDARAYARWLSAIIGAVYRLPNEDEWEWAARGGAETTFFWGDDLDQANQYANTYDDSSAAANHFRWPSNNLTDGFPWTAPVASFKPNGFGLYDVTANAREFVEDDWMPDLSRSVNDGSAHNGPAPFPTVRGGAWNYNPKNLRLNYRSAYLSSEVSTNMFGFRLVREL